MGRLLKNLCRALGLALCVYTTSGYAFSTPAWLYAVDVAVSDQTAAERTRAAREGLLLVLTRITGLTSIPQSGPMRQALNNADRYYDEFVFVAAEDASQPMALRISYQPLAIRQLVKDAQLPIWWTKRPKVMAWIVVDEQGERTLLDANTEHPLKSALKDAAAARGLEVELPLMDLQDHLKLQTEDVWGQASQVIAEVGDKYGAEINLIGRVTSSLSFRGRAIRGDWAYWLDGQRRSVDFNTDQFDLAVVDGVNTLVAELQDAYSVAALSPQRWEIRISGLRGTQPFAQMMNYLGGLDFIDNVALQSLQGHVATIVVESPARADQLLRLLTVEDRLAEDSLHLGSGVQLLWRG